MYDLQQHLRTGKFTIHISTSLKRQISYGLVPQVVTEFMVIYCYDGFKLLEVLVFGFLYLQRTPVHR